jgi:hypothetical protein
VAWIRPLLVVVSMNLFSSDGGCGRSLPRGQHTWARLQQVGRQQLRFGMPGTEIERLLGRPDRVSTHPCNTHACMNEPATPVCGSWTYYGSDQFKSLLLMVDVVPGEVRLRAWAY